MSEGNDLKSAEKTENNNDTQSGESSLGTLQRGFALIMNR